ncbi:MAG: response regulator, partial [Bacteroidetes bacterium]|nr:response regulator [Bacteroidota bacterium]
SVQDTGSGIPEDELSDIFERFYQVKEIQTGGGTGIGLALVRELVLLMGGEIHAGNGEGGIGAIFTIDISLEMAAEEPKITIPSRIIHPLPEKPLDRLAAEEEMEELPVLLIVEDNTDIQQYLTACLEGRYHLIFANDGEAGIQKAIEEVPDIILSDVMMPKKDGLEVVKTLKNNPATSHIPIVLLTARTQDEDRFAGLKLGADAYLAKPFHKQELFIHLEKLVELRRTLQQRYQAEEKNLPTENPVFQMQDTFIPKLQHVIEQNLDDDQLGMQDICREMGLSRTQFHRKIKALTGLSSTHFIRRFKLEKAKELLLTTQYSVSEIGYMLGFSSPSYFNRVFVELYQTTPTKMREKS